MQLSTEADGQFGRAETLRFGTFELSAARGELRKNGRLVRLQAQPMRVLAALLARHGETVSRQALQREVWGDDTHVDFERGLNFCIAQIRSALRDDAESPRFVETVPKLGYRFIAPVTVSPADPDGVAGTHPPVEREASAAADAVDTHGASAWNLPAAAALLLVVFTIGLGWISLPPARPTVVVVPFYNETGNEELEPVARAIGDATVAHLAAPDHIDALSVIGNAPSLQSPFARADVQRVARELSAEWVVIGQLKADGRSMRLIGHLIRASDMKHVWAHTYDEPSFTLDVQGRTAAAVASAVSRAVATR
ncbi:MAG: winged helix-turn-helix domain-containing protein [Vicinamibacterales bacterium]